MSYDLRIRYRQYGPHDSEQPQPGDQIIGWPRRFGPDRAYVWYGVDPDLTRDREFLSWVGGVVIGPAGTGGAYVVSYYDSDRGDATSDAFRSAHSIALRWEEMFQVMVKDAVAPGAGEEPA